MQRARGPTPRAYMPAKENEEMKHDPGGFYATHYGMGKTYYRDGAEIRIAPENVPQIIDDIERDARRRWQKARDLAARGNEAMGAFDIEKALLAADLRVA